MCCCILGRCLYDASSWVEGEARRRAQLEERRVRLGWCRVLWIYALILLSSKGSCVFDRSLAPFSQAAVERALAHESRGRSDAS